MLKNKFLLSTTLFLLAGVFVFGLLITPALAAVDPEGEIHALPGTGSVVPCTSCAENDAACKSSCLSCGSCSDDICKQYCGDYQINDLFRVLEFASYGVLYVIGAFAFIFFIYGGIILLVSGGNEDRIKKGRNILIGSIVGLIIAFTSYLIVDFTMKGLGIEDEWNISNWFEQQNK